MSGPLRENLFATVPKAHSEFVAAAFRSIFTLTTKAEVEVRWDEVETTLTDRFPKAAELMSDAKTDVLAFTVFPRATGARSGPTTRSSGSTRRSSAARTWSGSSPTTRP